MKDIVTNAIDRTCTVTGDCKNTDYSKMQNCINDLRLYNDMMADKSYYQRVEELQELRKENQQLKEQLELSEQIREKQKDRMNRVKDKIQRVAYGGSEDYYIGIINEIHKLLCVIKEKKE